MTSCLFKRLVFATVVLLMMAACSTAVEIGETNGREIPDQAEPAEAEPTAESTPATAAAEPTAAVATPVPAAQPTATATPDPTATAVPEPTPTTAPTATPAPVPTLAAIADVDHSGLAGTRGLTLQWISWEPQDWGTISFVPLVDGTYAVTGSQEGVNGEFVTVEGTIRKIGDRELLFTGEIVTQVELSGSEGPCVRSGDITFLATGDRRFWRMQDLLNCDGVITDYVDIYFG